MALAETEHLMDLTHPRSQGVSVWAVLDVVLLFLTTAVSSDMLVKTGSGQPAAWLICYSVALLRIVMVWPRYEALLQRNFVILFYPFVCLITLAWSRMPMVTFVSGMQLMMTCVIAIYLGGRYSLEAIIKSIFMVLFVAVVLSLVHWITGIFPWPVFSRTGGLLGVFSQKNMLGQRALFAALVIIAIWLMSLRDGSIRLKMIGVVAMPLTLLAMMLSQSMTSILLLFPLSGLLALLCLRQMPPSVSASMVLFTGMTVALGPVVLAIHGVDLAGAILAAVGKDATLTGRTELWHVARQVWADYPLLGVGYGAFWAAPEFANARLLTQHAGALTSVSFHNFILEILVGAGLPGAIAMLAVLVVAARRLLYLVVRTQSVAASCGLVLMVGMVVASFLGPSLYRAHEFMLTLLVMFTVSAQEDRLQRLQLPGDDG